MDCNELYSMDVVKVHKGKISQPFELQGYKTEINPGNDLTLVCYDRVKEILSYAGLSILGLLAGGTDYN